MKLAQREIGKADRQLIASANPRKEEGERLSVEMEDWEREKCKEEGRKRFRGYWGLEFWWKPRLWRPTAFSLTLRHHAPKRSDSCISRFMCVRNHGMAGGSQENNKQNGLKKRRMRDQRGPFSFLSLSSRALVSYPPKGLRHFIWLKIRRKDVFSFHFKESHTLTALPSSFPWLLESLNSYLWFPSTFHLSFLILRVVLWGISLKVMKKNRGSGNEKQKKQVQLLSSIENTSSFLSSSFLNSQQGRDLVLQFSHWFLATIRH